jgi:hypothetical protein
VLTRSRDGAFEVQVRQEPWQDSKTVAVTTPVAVKVGQRSVTFSPGTPLDVRIGGKPVNPSPRGTSLTAGAMLSTTLGCPSGALLSLTDGSEVCVWSIGKYGLAVLTRTADARFGTLEGLLGNGDGSHRTPISPFRAFRTMPAQWHICRCFLVGTAGFEPATPCSQSRCATKLRHVPLLLQASRGGTAPRRLEVAPSSA